MTQRVQGLRQLNRGCEEGVVRVKSKSDEATWPRARAPWSARARRNRSRASEHAYSCVAVTPKCPSAMRPGSSLRLTAATRRRTPRINSLTKPPLQLETPRREPRNVFSWDPPDNNRLRCFRIAQAEQRAWTTSRASIRLPSGEILLAIAAARSRLWHPAPSQTTRPVADVWKNPSKTTADRAGMHRAGHFRQPLQFSPHRQHRPECGNAMGSRGPRSRSTTAAAPEPVSLSSHVTARSVAAAVATLARRGKIRVVTTFFPQQEIPRNCGIGSPQISRPTLARAVTRLRTTLMRETEGRISTTDERKINHI